MIYLLPMYNNLHPLCPACFYFVHSVKERAPRWKEVASVLFKFSGLSRHDVSKDNAAFLFAIKHSYLEEALLGLLDPEDEGNMTLRNVGTCFSSDTL